MEIDDEFCSEDEHDQYFGDDDVADPDYDVAKEEKTQGYHKNLKRKKFNSLIEAESSFSRNKIKERNIPMFEHELALNASNNPLLNTEINIKWNRESSSSDEFDLPDDYLDVQRKAKERPKSAKNIPKDSKNIPKAAKRVKKESPIRPPTPVKPQTLDFGRHLHSFLNLNQLMLDQYNIKQDKRLAVQYLSTIVESNEHKYILQVLPLVFSNTMLDFINMTGNSFGLSQYMLNIRLANFCFSIRKYLESIIDSQEKESEYLSKTCDELLRHLVTHKEKQFCLMLSCHYFAKSQQRSSNNCDWYMQRFCDVARTTLQHIKPRRDGRGNVKLVDINDDMRSMIQVFIKVAARYDEFKKASKSFNMSENIGTGIDDLEDTLSVISGTSGFSSGSQMLQSKDYEDDGYDSEPTDIVEKRINYLARLEIPYQIFTSTNFDWAANMYSMVLEELSDAQGDYTALKEFHDALQHRITQQNSPYRQRIHRLILNISNRGNRFSSPSLVLENQLKYDLELNDNEIQFISNKLEEQAYQMENEKDTEDSMTEDLSDYNEDIIRKSKKIPSQSNADSVKKSWLLKQYQNLGTKAILQLDTKLIRCEGAFTLIGSLFRSIIMNLLRYAEHKDEKKDNQTWFRKSFPVSRVLKWNIFQYKKVYESNEKIKLMHEYSFFIEKLSNEILGEAWSQNPIAVLKKKDLQKMCKYKHIEDNLDAGISNLPPQPRAQSTLIYDINQMTVFDIPTFNIKLYEEVKLWRDVGLIFEYPREVAVHVVLKFIKLPENNMALYNEVVDDQYQEIICGEVYKYTRRARYRNEPLNQQSVKRYKRPVKNKAIPKIFKYEMLISTLLVQYLKCESKSDLGPSIMSYLNRTKAIIKEAVDGSIVNMFYMREETNNLPNVLAKYYEALKISEHYNDNVLVFESNFGQANNMCLEKYRKLLIRSLSGIECSADLFNDLDFEEEERDLKKIRGNCKQLLIKETARMKKLWNFAPFERKIKQVLKSPGDYVSTKLKEDVIVRAANMLFKNAWTPYRLESAIRITCHAADLSIYSEALLVLFSNIFSDLLV